MKIIIYIGVCYTTILYPSELDEFQKKILANFQKLHVQDSLLSKSRHQRVSEKIELIRSGMVSYTANDNRNNINFLNNILDISSSTYVVNSNETNMSTSDARSSESRYCVIAALTSYRRTVDLDDLGNKVVDILDKKSILLELENRVYKDILERCFDENFWESI